MIAIVWQHVLIGFGSAALLCLVFLLAWWLFHPSAEKRAQRLFRKYTRPEDRLDWSMDRRRPRRDESRDPSKRDP